MAMDDMRSVRPSPSVWGWIGVLLAVGVMASMPVATQQQGLAGAARRRRQAQGRIALSAGVIMVPTWRGSRPDEAARSLGSPAMPRSSRFRSLAARTTAPGATQTAIPHRACLRGVQMRLLRWSMSMRSATRSRLPP